MAKQRNTPNQHQGQTPTRGQKSNPRQTEITNASTTGEKSIGKKKRP